MTRILYVDEEPAIAGGANCLIALTRHMDRTRFVSLVACPPGPLADAVTSDGITHIPFPFRLRRLKTGRPGSEGRLVNPLALLQKVREGFALARLIRQQQIEIIHTNSLSPHIAGMVAARLTGIPCIWHVHTFHPSLLYRLALPDQIIFVSKALQRAAFGDAPPLQAHVIYNGQDFSIFDPTAPHPDLRAEWGPSGEHMLVGITARLEPWKGHRVLLRAWQMVATEHPRARLLIVGDEIVKDSRQPATYRAELEQMAHDLGIADSVIFTGFRPDIPAVLHTLDVLVSASTHLETFSLSVLEGMAMGKAIVATRVGGVPELTGDGEAALMVEDGDVPGMAAAIERFLTDPALRAEYGARAHRRALAEFSVERYVSQIESLYDRVLTQS
ncbi:MAG: glycosyltransferase family 4 protein [Anaerolineae bacterium]|nr:glycosyltransferase family 4 protein [Anaerolineae bacterium]